MISVVIPCYNEDQALNRLFERLTAAAENGMNLSKLL